jgi:dipeptidyl aminopeptidase/acylaminoacyl peptidase
VLDVDDLWEIRSAKEARIAPEGRRIAFALTTVDRGRDRTGSELWLLESDQAGRWGDPRLLCPGREPSWAPDGRHLAFLRDPDEGGEAGTEMHLLALAGGGPRKLATLPGRAQGASFSPDGGRLALETSNGPDGSSRIALIEVQSGSVELLGGAEGCEDTGPSWAPDGTRLAFGRLHPPVGDAAPAGTVEVAAARAGATSRQVATGLAFACLPTFSPDGETLACIGTGAPRLGPNDACLQPWLVSVEGGRARLAAEGVHGLVVSPLPQGPVWSADGRRILFREARAGDTGIAAAEVADAGPARTLVDGLHVLDFSAVPGGETIAFAAASATDPGSVHVLEGERRRSLSASSSDRHRGAGATVPASQRRSFRSPHGYSLDGWLQGLDQRRSPQPLLLGLHGGPHGYFGTGFQLGHFYRSVLASRGWLVLAVNATGSGSYGEAFADAIRGRWGEYDLPEHLGAVDELVAEGLADPTRMVVAGYSYGGYLAAWAACTEDRFRAAVVGAPITDLESFGASSDIGRWYTSWEMGGGLPDNVETYRRLSPLTHVGSLRTPVLLLHGEADRRCPFGQSLEFLRRAEHESEATVELIGYEDAGHLFHSSGRPSQRIDFNRRIVEWAERMIEPRDE